jgi:hypothetical protein
MRGRIPRTIATVVGQMWCQRYLMAGLVDSLRARAAAPQKKSRGDCASRDRPLFMNEGIGSRACAAMTDCSSDLSRTGERIASTAKEVTAVV